MSSEINPEIPSNVKLARSEARQLVSPDFRGKDRRDVIFLLTLANMAHDILEDRPNIDEYYQYVLENQDILLSLARQFDAAVENLNKTAGGDEIDPSLVNTIAVRTEGKLGKDGTIPLLLGEGKIRPKNAITEFKAGVQAFEDQHGYMSNSELAEHDPQFLKEITESGQWSRLHLDAKSPKHFLATFIIDLYPMMLRRTGRYGELDTDELVRALCESLDPNTVFFRLIREQGWYMEGEFSKSFVTFVNETGN